MSNQNAATASEGEPDRIPFPFAKFLESTPPGQSVQVSGLFVRKNNGYSIGPVLSTPELRLHCPSADCDGIRTFRHNSSVNGVWLDPEKDNFEYVDYICSNCRRSKKVYSLSIRIDAPDGGTGAVYKFGELPAFGPPTPSRLLRLFGKDADVFLKGRRCENQGLGIGAFTYYRRVVENHKDELLDQVLRVAAIVGAPREAQDQLAQAKSEIQFAKAMKLAKDAVPQSLLVNGRNPLALLHTALSVGVHELTDERCLERAHDVRMVLADLVERMGQALKDEAELTAAVNRLAKPASP